MEYQNRLRLLDAVDYLEDRLEVLRESGEITQALHARKKTYSGLIRAVNRADQLLCAAGRETKTVSLYVPSGLHILPLTRHDFYTGEQIDGVLSTTLSELHPSTIDLFVYNEPWTEIRSILSEIVVYEHYQQAVDAETQPGICPSRKRFINSTASGFHSPGFSDRFWFDIKNRILHLSSPLAEDSFLVFVATVAPGSINTREYDVSTRAEAEQTELDDALLMTDLLHEDLLLSVAIAKLLPGVVTMPSLDAVVYERAVLSAGNGSVMYSMEE